VVLSNLGCLYNLLERSQYAVTHFQDCFQLLEDDPAGQAEAQMKLSLTCAANGDNYEAIEHCLQCLKQCRLLNDHHKEVLKARVLARTKKKVRAYGYKSTDTDASASLQASCLFTLGTIYYEAGEVRQAVEAFEQCLVLRRKTRDKVIQLSYILL
jgi:tetratricopeptide (TPR) repeat protein